MEAEFTPPNSSVVALTPRPMAVSTPRGVDDSLPEVILSTISSITPAPRSTPMMPKTEMTNATVPSIEFTPSNRKPVGVPSLTPMIIDGVKSPVASPVSEPSTRPTVTAL